jgi:hypothetical protein
MTKRTCLGCGIELSGDVATLEHILPKWLASEIKQPNVNLKHFVHDEEKAEDTVIRSHGLNTFTTKQVCGTCNNGWMSRLETESKPLILSLMHLNSSVLMLTDEERRTLSRWATKTAFMIAAVQTTQFDLPWHIFQSLGKVETCGPDGCFVFASQQANLPKGFLYTSPSDYFSKEAPIQVRLGFSIDHLHFVVVIPFDDEPRVAKIVAGIHTPLWPLQIGVLAYYQPIPKALTTANLYLDFLTNLIEVGVLKKHEMVGLELVKDG